MASFHLKNSAIKGIASAVPARVEGLADLATIFGDDEMEKVAKSTGVYERHIAEKGQCTSDLCLSSTLKLFKELEWEPDTIDALIMVSQSFDYFCPATSCVLHGTLGLSKNCAAFDIALGCSGYIYGLWTAASLISSGCRRVILLAGDTSTKTLSPLDKSTLPLFGDAGTATAIEYSKDSQMHFEFGTDGTGYKHLIVPAGGARRPRDSHTAIRTQREGGNIRSDEDLFMDGAEVFTFTLREVPPMMTKVLASAKWGIEDVDAFVFHQANRFILDYLSKKLKLPPDKVPYSLKEFGNTSSASIPLTISHALGKLLQKEKRRLALGGFGIGFSWGAATLETGPMALPEIEVVK